jgi:preprotein translocase subunit SecE
MKKITAYIKETFDELLNKVSWPSWSELQSSALIVSIASLIIALVVFLMDFSFSNLLKQFYKLF